VFPFCVVVASPNTLTGSPQAAGLLWYQLDLLCCPYFIVGSVGSVGLFMSRYQIVMIA